MLNPLSFLSENIELFRVGISFLFIFALIFGILQITKRKIKIDEKNFREERLFPERVNILLALAIALISISYKPFIDFIWNLLPISSIIFIIFFFIAFIKESIKSEEKDPIPFLVSIGILILVLGVFGEFFNFPFQHYIPFSQKDILWIIGIILVILFFYLGYLSRGKEKEEAKKN
ncbi:MAG: hypothetical protein QXM64_01180 [Candidatus Aenigmatarchaeota archaeon]